MTHKIIEECRQAFITAIEEDHTINGSNSTHAVTTVSTKDGYIELYIDRYGAQAAVVHNNEAHNAQEHPTLEATICAHAPEWWDAKDEEVSTIDDGFSSYQDYIDYMYR